MKYLKRVLKYAAYGFLLPFIVLAILFTFAVVAMDWYVETIQQAVEGVDEACG